jgi:hypothetical protein
MEGISVGGRGVGMEQPVAAGIEDTVAVEVAVDVDRIDAIAGGVGHAAGDQDRAAGDDLRGGGKRGEPAEGRGRGQIGSRPG